LLLSLRCRAWLKLIAKVDNWSNSIAFIGETTGSAAKELGLKSIYYPTSPGLEGYAHIMLPFEWHYPIMLPGSIFCYRFLFWRMSFLWPLLFSLFCFVLFVFLNLCLFLFFWFLICNQ
jgi:hypothetical protein